MRVTEVSYRRVFNLGDYNSEELQVKIAIDPEEKVTGEEALLEARKIVAETSYKALSVKKKSQQAK